MFIKARLEPLGKHDKAADPGKQTKDKGNRALDSVLIDHEGSGASSESDFSLRQRYRKSKTKKPKKKVGRPRKEEPFIVFERAELRPSTIEDCVHTALYKQQIEQ